MCQDLHQAFASVDHDNDGVVNIKDIPLIFTHLDQTYKSFLIEEDDLKHLIPKIDIDSLFFFVVIILNLHLFFK